MKIREFINQREELENQGQTDIAVYSHAIIGGSDPMLKTLSNLGVGETVFILHSGENRIYVDRL